MRVLSRCYRGIYPLTTAQATGGSRTDTLLNIEIYPCGSNYNDVITSSSRSNKIYGLGGNDSIAVAAGNSADYFRWRVGIDTISRATAGVSIYLSLKQERKTVGSGTDTILNLRTHLVLLLMQCTK